MGGELDTECVSIVVSDDDEDQIKSLSWNSNEVLLFGVGLGCLGKLRKRRVVFLWWL